MSFLSIPDIPNVSLVAFYGKKPPELALLIKELKVYLSQTKVLKGKFIPYELEQIHGTIIGCESLRTETGIVNKWFYEKRQEIRCLDLPGLLDYLKNCSFLPLNICFGNYQLTSDYGFLSRNQHPYYRSFQLQPSRETNKIAVLIGWTFFRDSISLGLDNLRRALQQFNLLHKYHDLSETIDNDFYLRLGTISNISSPEAIATIEKEIREILQAKSPVYLSITPEDLVFVQYQDLSLPPETTKILPVLEATPTKLEALFPLDKKRGVGRRGVGRRGAGE